MEKFGFLERGLVISLLCLVAAVASRAQTFTTLHSFDGTDGAVPNGLVQGADGNFYGTTGVGGAINPCSADGDPGCGTIFQITPTGTLTTLHSFSGSDGANPAAGLIQGSDGKFYGTTSFGGIAGTIFSIIPGRTPVTLYNFCSQTNCTDGSNPAATLVQGSDGNFYGTTSRGGASDSGTVFKITPSGTLTTLYSFDGTTAANPSAALVQSSDGNFYGTTISGGALGCGPSNPEGDCGTIFKISPHRAR